MEKTSNPYVVSPVVFSENRKRSRPRNCDEVEIHVSDKEGKEEFPQRMPGGILDRQW
jgi:hypothetical protein